MLKDISKYTGLEDGSWLYNKKRKIPLNYEKIKQEKLHKEMENGNKKTKDHIIPRMFLRELMKNNIRLVSFKENNIKGNRLTKEGIEKILTTIIKFL